MKGEANETFLLCLLSSFRKEESRLEEEVFFAEFVHARRDLLEECAGFFVAASIFLHQSAFFEANLVMEREEVLIKEPAVFHHAECAENLYVILDVLNGYVVEILNSAHDLVTCIAVSEDHRARRVPVAVVCRGVKLMPESMMIRLRQ